MKKILLCVLALSTIKASAQTLQMHWTFNSGNVNEVHAGIPVNPAKCNGAVSVVAGKSGLPAKAVRFNGSTNLVYDNDSAMNFGSWTMTAVIRPLHFYSGQCQHNDILARGDEYGSAHYALGYFDQWVDNDCSQYHPDSEVFFGAAAGNSGFPIGDWSGNIASSPRINPGRWYCVTASYDSTVDSMYLYVDGVHVVTGYWPDGYHFSGLEDLYIGSSKQLTPGWFTGYPYWLNADVDDIKFFSGSLVGNANPGYFSSLECETGAAAKSLNIEETQESAQVNVYPNPAKSAMSVEIPANWQEADFSIFNMLGAMVQYEEAASTGATKIDLSRLPAGTYTLHVTAKGGHSIMKKIVKQ